MGDFQGVVTLGVARASKCIFPYRGARFSKGVPPHVHAHGCTWPRRMPRRCPSRWKMARKQGSGKRKRQALEKIDPKTFRHGKMLAEVGKRYPKKVQRQAEVAQRYPKTVQRGKMLAEAANRYPKTVKWGKLSGFGQVLGKMLAEAAKRYPKTVHRQAEAASVGQK